MDKFEHLNVKCNVISVQNGTFVVRVSQNKARARGDPGPLIPQNS